VSDLVTDLDHVSVTCPEDLAGEVLGWYEEIFGLERVPKPEGTRPNGGWFKVGTHELHIQIDEHNPPRSAHFALAVGDLDEVLARLRAAGCHVEQAVKIPGRNRFFVRDPAGNKVEVTSMEGTA
jgi:catechol 2,3-dioxygenase-like lactoylglutathione lyase family enzyme